MSKAAGRVFKRLLGVFDDSLPSKSNPTNATATDTTIKKSRAYKQMLKFKKSSESSEFRARVDIYRNTVKRFADSKRFHMISEILDHQKNFKDITNEAFTCRLISLYGKAGMFLEAQKLFDEMPQLNCSRTILSFNTLLTASVRSGKFEDFKRILEEVPGVLGVSLDVVSYNVAIKGFSEMGDLDKAISLLEEMVEANLEPTLITFNTLLSGLFKNGRFEEGERMWDRMVEADFRPDLWSYNAKLLGLTLGNRMEEAVELVEEMKGKGIKLDTHSFNAFIRGYASVGNSEEAKKWYGNMGEDGCLPDELTFKTLIPLICDKGDLGFALELCEEIFEKKYPVKDEVLQFVVDGLLLAKKVPEAEKLVEIAKRSKHKLFVL